MNVQIHATHMLIREAATDLANPSWPEDRNPDSIHEATGRVLAAMAARVEEQLEATPDAMRTRPYVESFAHHNIPGWHEAVLLAVMVTGHPMRPEWRVGQEIRSTHPDSFMRGEWGSVVGVEDMDGRLVWAIRWPDGATDLWRCEDPMNVIEFREPAPPEPPVVADLTRIVIGEVPE